MAVRSREEILERVKTFTDGRSDDDALGFIEDITDTLTDYDTRLNDSTDWKTKYEENDNEWRNRYRDRFFGKDETPAPTTEETVLISEEVEEEEITADNITIDDLFTEV